MLDDVRHSRTTRLPSEVFPRSIGASGEEAPAKGYLPSGWHRCGPRPVQLTQDDLFGSCNTRRQGFVVPQPVGPTET